MTKLSLVAQIMPKPYVSRINPVPGEKWSGARGPGWTEPNRWLYNHELVFFASGEGRIITPEISFDCLPGDAVIIPPSLLHCTIAGAKGVERFCFHFDWEPGPAPIGKPWVFSTETERFDTEKCNKTPDWLPLKLPAKKRFPAPAKTRAVMEEMMLCDSGEPSGALALKGLLTRVLSDFFSADARAGGGGARQPSVFLRAKEYFDRNFRDSETGAASAAASLRITPNHLCKLFRRNLGVSPVDYLHSLRFSEARSLMTDGGRNISEAAYEAGFSDANYFSRLFRKKHGAPPSKFLDMERGK
jgi:AraC-like DNA-binding protein